MKYIFLDIDGVLNNDRTEARSPQGYIGISPGLVKRLAKIVKATDAQIILSSTWKTADDIDFKYLTRKLMQSNLYLSGKTKEPEGRLYIRGYGIKKFLETHECDEYVILDDEVFDFREEGILDHAVITDWREGLTKDDVDKAICVLNGHLVDIEDYNDIFVWGYHH